MFVEKLAQAAVITDPLLSPCQGRGIFFQENIGLNYSSHITAPGRSWRAFCPRLPLNNVHQEIEKIYIVFVYEILIFE